MDQITPPSVRPLTEVKDKAIAAWQAEKRTAEVAKKATALAGDVKPGTQLSAISASQGLKAATSPPFQRQSENAAGVPAVLVEKLFAAKPGGVVTASDGTGSYIAQLTKVDEPPVAGKNVTADLSREVTSGIQTDLAEEFTQTLRARFPVEVHRETLDRLF
jgi:peptidyl-prolyl cis-trans isomerase D